MVISIYHRNIAINKISMGLSKSDLFTRDQNELASLAKALAHPARIAIIQHLLITRECINGSLVQQLGLAQATISQHLKALKEVGLIQGTIDGAAVSYCINSLRWKEVQQRFAGLFAQYSPVVAEGDCC